MSKQPKKPLGRALERTDADLERLAQITGDDMDAAEAEAIEPMAELLRAPTDEGDA